MLLYDSVFRPQFFMSSGSFLVRLSVFVCSVSEHLVETIVDITLTVGFLNALCDILADGLTLRLCE